MSSRNSIMRSIEEKQPIYNFIKFIFQKPIYSHIVNIQYKQIINHMIMVCEKMGRALFSIIISEFFKLEKCLSRKKEKKKCSTLCSNSIIIRKMYIVITTKIEKTIFLQKLHAYKYNFLIYTTIHIFHD